MKFRRSKDEPTTDDADDTTEVDDSSASGSEAASEAGPADTDPRADGPWDLAQSPHALSEPTVIDLGGLVVRGRPGFDLQIPADEGTDRLAAVLLVVQDAAVEIRAFAAPRTGGLWDEVRAEIVAEVGRLDGQVEEVEGRHGTELQIQVPARTPDGQDAVQPSRIVGVEGPRWFLRGTFMGRAALEPDDDGLLERGFRDIAVRRGDEAMPPREPIAIVLPEGTVPAADDAAQGSSDREA